MNGGVHFIAPKMALKRLRKAVARAKERGRRNAAPRNGWPESVCAIMTEVSRKLSSLRPRCGLIVETVEHHSWCRRALILCRHGDNWPRDLAPAVAESAWRKSRSQKVVRWHRIFRERRRMLFVCCLLARNNALEIRNVIFDRY